MKFGTLIIGTSFLISKILGVVRDNLLASNFGAEINLDMYYAAFRLPDFLFNLLSYGVISAAFIPLFAGILKKENKEKAFEFTNQILFAFALFMLGISVLLFMFAPYLTKLIVPGFSAQELNTTITLTRIMMVTPVLFTISSIISGVQNALQKFIGIALAPVGYNLGIILGIIFLIPKYGIYGVAIGVVIGASLNVIVQLPVLILTGFKLKLPIKLWGERIKEMLTLSLPRIFGMSISQLSLVIDTVIASSLPAGSIAIINFSSNIESLPLGLIGITASIVSFGTLASFAAEQKTDAFVHELSLSIRKILFLLIPITLGMFLLRFQIVRLFLGRGLFDWTDTILTANTLGLFLTGLSFGGLIFILARSFYAYKDTKTPVLIGFAAVCVNITLSLILTKVYSWDTYGLAFSNAAANILNASLLILFLQKKLRQSIIDPVEIGKFVIAALIMAVAVQFTKDSFGNIFEDINTYAELITQTGASILIGASIYFLCVWILRSKELLNFISALQKRRQVP